MRRALALTLLLLLACGCQDVRWMRDRAGPGAAWAAGGSRPADPEVVARRLLADGGVDGTASPSRDGRFIAYTDWSTGDLAVRELDGGPPRFLTGNEAPFRPGYVMFPEVDRTGDRIAFTWLPEDEATHGAELRVIGSGGGEARRVRGGGLTWIHAEDWSPDGRWILVYEVRETDRAGRIVLLSPAGELRLLKTVGWRGPTRMRFSPDGRYIAYDYAQADSTSHRDIHVLDLESGREGDLVRHRADDALLGWSPDGDHVLLSSDRTGTPGVWLLPVENGAASGEPRLVRRDFWRADPLGITGDGRFLYSVATGSRNVHIARLDPATGRVVGTPRPAGPAPATGAVIGLAWSPDGESLAYRLHRPPFGLVGRNSILVRSTATGAVRDLPLPAGLYPGAVRWSSDGRSLVHLGRDRSGRRGIYRMDLQTGRTVALHRLTTSEYAEEFDLLPDGRTIVQRLQTTAGPKRWRVRARDLVSGAERLVVESTRRLDRIATSPSGREVAALVEADAPSRLDVVVYPMDGRESRTVASTTAGARLAWAPDGRWILFSRPPPPDSGSEATVWRAAVGGDEVEPLGLAMDAIGFLRVAPDGERLAVIAGSTSTEVWVLENLLPVEVEP